MKRIQNVVREFTVPAVALGVGLSPGAVLAADCQVVDRGANVSPHDICSSRFIAALSVRKSKR